MRHRYYRQGGRSGISLEKLQRELNAKNCHPPERYGSAEEARSALQNQPTVEAYNSLEVTFCTGCNWYILQHI